MRVYKRQNWRLEYCSYTLMHMLCWSGIHHLICSFYQSELIFCQDLLLYCGPEILCFPCVESPTYPSLSLNKQISLFCWFRNSLCWPVLVKPTGKPLSLPGDHSGGAPGPQPAGLMRGLTAGQSESERKYVIFTGGWPERKARRDVMERRGGGEEYFPCSTVHCHCAKFRGMKCS